MRISSFLLASALACLPGITAAVAQTPAPAAASATCKDGTSWTGKSHSGACRGHGGVKSFDTAATAPADTGQAGSGATATAPAVATPDATAPKTAAPAAATPAATTRHRAALPANPAPGGGPGKVWVNSDTKVYHCLGDRYYGKTKAGEYMTEDAAKAAGDKPARSKACAS